MNYLIKLWERFGPSTSNKPYSVPYYAMVYEITAAQYSELASSGRSIYEGNPPVKGAGGILLDSFGSRGSWANNPGYIFKFYNQNPAVGINYCNTCDFYLTDNYEFLTDGLPTGGNTPWYLDISTDSEFANVISRDINFHRSGGAAWTSAYSKFLCFTLNYTDGFKYQCPCFFKIVDDNNKIYTCCLNIQYNNNRYYGIEMDLGGYDAAFSDAINNIEPYVPETDPYAPGGYSDVSPGNGTFDLTSDTISIPNLPTLSATNAGLVTVYIPTGPQLNTFASLLFGRTFLDAFLNAVTTLFVDPLEAVIGLSIIPVAPSLDTAKQVTVAFIGLTTPDGPLMMQPAASQYVEVNCGTIHVDEYSGSALDYAPYSKFHIYLPYIGTRELSTDEIRNKDLRVVYHIDIVSGSCVALLEVDGSVLYQFAGNCATPIPINGRDFSRMVTAGIQLAAAFAGGSAGAGVGSVAAGNIRKPADYISTNSSFKTLVKTLDSEEGVMPTANKTAGTGIDAEHLVSATAGVVSGMKPHIQHASGIGGSAGMLGVQKPYLIAEIPRQSLAKDYNKFVGYPSNITSVLGELNGFTQIEMIHLKGIPCTETELSEIDKMLKSGVIL